MKDYLDLIVSGQIKEAFLALFEPFFFFSIFPFKLFIFNKGELDLFILDYP